MALKLLGISGSLRRQSCNTGLLRAAQQQLPPGWTLELADLSDIPFYNADVKDKPPAVTRVLAQMAEADAFVFACPEYNYSIAPALKNIIDWASREPDNALLAGKTFALMGAGGRMGTSRSQHHLRQVCASLDLHALNKPEVYTHAFTGGFDTDGNPTDPKIIQLIADQMQALAVWSQRIKA